MALFTKAPELVCPRCMKRYRIGENATIVGVHDAWQDLMSRGLGGVINAPDPDARPYVVSFSPNIGR